MTPNPSFDRTRDRGRRMPGTQHAVHRRRPGVRHLFPRPGELRRSAARGVYVTSAEEHDRRFDRERDELANEMFEWREMTPEEWYVRYGHIVGCFSLHLYRYRDPVLGAWIRRLGELLTRRVDEAQIEVYRRQYLTVEEYARIQGEIAEIEEHGL